MVSRETPGHLPPWLEPARPILTRYAEILGTRALEQGLIGPREVPRLWDRHLLNCAVVAEPTAGLVPLGADCVDVGSGAGLPGLVWAAVRPDLTVVLIEPLLRRSTFLGETVADLGLAGRVQVVRGRAEDLSQLAARFDVVTARAVAPLGRLLGWTAPLLRPGGSLVLLKGRSAADELRAAEPEIQRAGLTEMMIASVGEDLLPTPTVLIVGRRPEAQ